LEETKKDSVEKSKVIMITAHKYITKEYRALLRNATLVLSIVMFAVVAFDIILAIIAPNWPIRLFVSAGVLMSMLAAWFLYTAVEHFIDHRNPIVMAKWIASYISLFVGVMPIMLFVYLNLDWHLLATYGRMAFDIYLSSENMVLPIALMLLFSLIYWTLTIQLYKKSYTTYLCMNKKEEIYGK